MPRYEMPPDLSPDEERLVLAALEQAIRSSLPRLSPWTIAGRAEALRLGSLQIRRDTETPWTFRGNVPFARRGTPQLGGRGDAR
ncbi:MAG TPA: hypothetical protein VFH75_03080 [Actinomycetota bacterium]|nr:hypothetical protein [Actinomycetota bacterium]